MGKRAIFQTHIDDAGAWWYPLWEGMNRFYDPDGCHNYGWNIVQDKDRLIPTEECVQRPPWLPEHRWTW